MPVSPKSSRFAILALVVAVCCWGTGFFFGKVALAEMSVTYNVTLRFVIGALLLTPFLPKRGTFAPKDFRLLLFAAFIGIPVQFLIQFKGLQLTTVSHASLMIGTLPVMLALASIIFTHDRLRPLEWLALGISTLGAILIARAGAHSTALNGPSLVGDLLVIASMVTAVFMILTTKRLMRTYNPLQMTAAMINLGTLMLVAILVATQPLSFHFSGRAWGAVAAQGVLASALAYVCWNWGLSHIAAARSGVFVNIEPIMGLVLGIALLHERPGVTAFIGGGMILASAIYLSMQHEVEAVALLP